MLGKEVHTEQPLAPGPSRLEVEIATEFKKYKSPGRDQILAELIQQVMKYRCP
jgi:hypothetical protein